MLPFENSLVLENHRVHMRPIRATDIDALLPGALDTELWKYITLQICNRRDLEALMEKLLLEREQGQGCSFVITDKSNGRLVGFTGFYEFVPQYRRIMIGRTFLFKEARGTGISKASKYELIRYAFSTSAIQRIGSYVDVLNVRSKKALMKAGFQEEGVLRAYQVSTAGRVLDIAVYSLLRSEWDVVRTTAFSEYSSNSSY